MRYTLLAALFIATGVFAGEPSAPGKFPTDLYPPSPNLKDYQQKRAATPSTAPAAKGAQTNPENGQPLFAILPKKEKP